MKYLFLSLGLCLAPVISQAQDSASMPIDLVADSGYYDQVAGIAVYEGNVKIAQGASTIWADKIKVTLKNNAAQLIEATSNGKGLVKFVYKGEKQPIKGQGNKATYKVPSKTVTLTGNAKVEQGKDVVKGNSLTYDLAKEVIKGSRVRMTFLPSGQ